MPKKTWKFLGSGVPPDKLGVAVQVVTLAAAKASAGK
jgi:hypothetical protein